MACGSPCWYLTRLLMLPGLMALSLLPAQRVYAHANLLRAVPEPNAVLQQPLERVTLWFSERLRQASVLFRCSMHRASK
jgi:methionine-rich copper-binding protein CopC